MLAVFTALFISCNNKSADCVYNFHAVSNSGADVDFASYKGKVLLIVNTASKCGFTPQYDGLQALFDAYKDKGLVVIGFPCDQFGHQEPGSNEEIEQFCRLNYGVTFPLMEKIEVNGEAAHPLYQWLYSKKPFTGFGEGKSAEMMDQILSRKDPAYAENPDIKWNFTKFLIDRKGQVVERYEPTVAPEAIASAIEALL